jgi:hypothetical protein
MLPVGAATDDEDFVGEKDELLGPGEAPPMALRLLMWNMTGLASSASV